MSIISKKQHHFNCTHIVHNIEGVLLNMRIHMIWMLIFTPYETSLRSCKKTNTGNVFSISGIEKYILFQIMETKWNDNSFEVKIFAFISIKMVSTRRQRYTSPEDSLCVKKKRKLENKSDHGDGDNKKNEGLKVINHIYWNIHF